MLRLATARSSSSAKRLAAATASPFGSHGGIRSAATSRGLHSVTLQLDYYMSAQFAGVACAVTNDLYTKAGLDVNFLPICPVGLEMRRVRDHADASSSSGGGGVTVGSVEQNIFIPTLYEDPSLKVKAVAANFRKSPLCLASLSANDGQLDADGKIVIGAHEDTVSLIQRIVSLGPDADKYSVVASPRATKNTDLKSGAVGAIQAYTTTEVPTLERELGADAVSALMLEGLNGAKLGYSQVLFAPEEDLDPSTASDKREVLQSFLDVTFKGWDMAIRNHDDAAKCVDECRTQLGLDEEKNDHWVQDSRDYTIQNVGLCCDAVKETFQGDRLGVINADRWGEATEWLLDDKTPPAGKEEGFGVDTSEVWQPSSKLLAGNELGRRTLDEAKQSAEEFLLANGRKPSLVVITVGELTRYTHAEKRLQYYSNGDYSWFSKTTAGEANGFDVTEVNLPDSTTTDELLSTIYAHKTTDTYQLMWPLPPHIDATLCYNALDVSKDADGAHYIGQLELDPTSATPPVPPVTPAAALALLDEHGLGDVSNKSVLVVGRSRIVGSPLARMLTARGAVVTTAHSGVSPDTLASLVGTADVVVSCVGTPGLIDATWLKPEAVTLSVGTRFVEEKDALLSDFAGDLAQSGASKYSPVPGGIGPLSLPFLFKNVAECAHARVAAGKGDVESTIK